MELRCYAYRRGPVWEAICTDLDVAVFGSSECEVRRSLAAAIDLHLDAVVGLPSADRQGSMLRRAPWSLRLWLELLSRLHDLRGKRSKPGKPGEIRERVRYRFVIRGEIAVLG